MARKKHHRKKHSRRRRSSHMGATASNVTTVLSMVAGAVAGKVLQNKLSSKVNPKILAGGQIVLGMALPRFVKNKFVQGIGAGMVVNGGVTALSEFGVISAINGLGADTEVEYISGYDDEMSGSADIQTIAGDDEMSGSADIQTIAGYEDEISGYEDEMSGFGDF